MKSIGPKISDRHYEMLKALVKFFEGQRPAIEQAIEETYIKYIQRGGLTMEWRIYAQNPENYDDQGVYIVPADEVIDDDRAWMEAEFDGINDPGKTGIIIRDLASGQKWAQEVYSLRGDVVAVEIF